MAKKITIGSIVRGKIELKDRYYDYPRGYNLNIFPPGTLFEVISTPYKVCMVKGEHYDNKHRFLNMIPVGLTKKDDVVISTDFCNVTVPKYDPSWRGKK